MDDRVKIAIAVVVTCLLAFGAALVFSDEQYCFDEAGALIDIPDKFKLVLVPAHWKEEDIYRESHRATAVAKVMVRVCDDGVLVVSPAYCPQVEQPVAVEGSQCGNVLVISPATCTP